MFDTASDLARLTPGQPRRWLDRGSLNGGPLGRWTFEQSVILGAAGKPEDGGARPLDPQIGGLILSCAPKRATQGMGVG
jgi:hypothetical protein